ncbi:stage II sporulation protein R [Clostridium sp. CAG:793]|nr:stage II sporulation protein R [Clostridium sp. CAG:793]
MTKLIKKPIFITITAFVFFLIFSAYSYASSISSDLSKSVFRLHVIANSDSDEDQSLKLQVRDKLLDYMNSITANVSSKDDAIKIAQDHQKDFQIIAEQTILDKGYSYPVTVEIGNYEFPTKHYGDITLPSGYYDALRVKIGDACGHNWWCVMFPPLCFVDVTSGIVPESSKDQLKENMSSEDYSIISNDNSLTEFKFKIVELFKNFNTRLANK